MPTDDYVLGHSPEELERLDLQGALYRSITRTTMLQAGVSEGMKVLDIRCGSGDVSRLAASLVGPSCQRGAESRDPCLPLSGV